MTRVLLVDDSPAIRRLFSAALGATPDIEVVGQASDPFHARDRILELAPDVMVLDVEMPRMDGITFLKKLMRYHPLAVVVCSTLTTHGSETALEAMEAGAVAVVGKPRDGYPKDEMLSDLVEAVREASAFRARDPAGRPGTTEPLGFAGDADGVVLAIGASTGGTVAVETILRRMPKSGPPVVVTQHMPAYITEPFVRRLDALSPMEVRAAADGAPLRPGVALVAPGGKHLVVERSALGLRARVKDGPLVNGHRPSVDVMFHSVARAVGRSAVAALLTGMGRDGAKGLLGIRAAGGHTIAQDEATSVVFGMPKAAIELRAAAEVAGLPRMADQIVAAAERARSMAQRASLA